MAPPGISPVPVPAQPQAQAQANNQNQVASSNQSPQQGQRLPGVHAADPANPNVPANDASTTMTQPGYTTHLKNVISTAKESIKKDFEHGKTEGFKTLTKKYGFALGMGAFLGACIGGAAGGPGGAFGGAIGGAVIGALLQALAKIPAAYVKEKNTALLAIGKDTTRIDESLAYTHKKKMLNFSKFGGRLNSESPQALARILLKSKNNSEQHIDKLNMLDLSKNTMVDQKFVVDLIKHATPGIDNENKQFHGLSGMTLKLEECNIGKGEELKRALTDALRNPSTDKETYKVTLKEDEQQTGNGKMIVNVKLEPVSSDGSINAKSDPVNFRLQVSTGDTQHDIKNNRFLEKRTDNVGPEAPAGQLDEGLAPQPPAAS